jgi:DNA-binding CsgD family transcriptional regulator/tetratricopeptide (TPR) repeat protein
MSAQTASLPYCQAAGRASDFVGRDQELGELARILGRPHTVMLIEGEAGIGKSRLLRECLAGDARRVLLASCPPFRQPQTLAPLTHALRQAVDSVAELRPSMLAGALRPLFPEWAADLPPIPEPAEDSTAVRHRLFRALDELIERLGITKIAVEDAHWADEATLEFLLYLASDEARRPSLIVTYRPEDVPQRSLLPRISWLATGASGLRLGLGPLDLPQTAALASSLLGDRQIPDEFAAFVYERTEGVPLAVEELVRLLADRAGFGGRPDERFPRGVTEIAVPPTVRDAVLERAGRLSAAAQVMLAAAAAVAEEADEALLLAVSALPPDLGRAGLIEALRCGLLDESDRGLISFRHSLAAQAVYEATPGPERRVLHLRAGRYLEGRSPQPTLRLLRHFREAGHTVAWCRYAERAAGLAVESGDESAALQLLCDVISHVDQPECSPIVALLDRMNFATVADPASYQKVEHSLRALLDKGSGRPAEMAAVRMHLGRLLGLMEEYEGSRTELERAVPLLAADPARAARAMSMLGWPHDATSPALTHLRWLRRAARSAGSLQPAERRRVLFVVATALLTLGEEDGWVTAARVIDEAASAADTELQVLSCQNIGDLAIMWGRYPQARRWLEQGLALAETHHYERYRGVILVNRAHLDWLTGDWAGLAARASRLCGDQSMAGNLDASMIIGLLGTAMESGARSESRLRHNLTERLRRGSPCYVMEPAGALARVLLASGRVQEALDVCDEPIAILQAKRTWLWAAEIVPARVEALAAAGRIDEAGELAESFARGLRGRDAPAPRAAAGLCRAIIAEARGEQARAAALFGRAAAAWRALPRPYDALLATERQARCVLRAGEPERGATLLRGVLGGFSHLGATVDAARAGHELREQPFTGRESRTGRRGYGSQLSPRELDVARLLLAGGTNREIGQQLFLSPKTVARHLDSAMRKFGVSSRTALAVRLMETGVTAGDGPAQPANHR